MSMNAIEKGAKSSGNFLRTGHITLGGKQITGFLEEITMDQYTSIGNEAAHHFYKTENAIQGFIYGWGTYGAQYSNLMQGVSLKPREDTFQAGQRMPAQIIQFHRKRDSA